MREYRLSDDGHVLALREPAARPCPTYPCPCACHRSEVIMRTAALRAALKKAEEERDAWYERVCELERLLRGEKKEKP